MENVINSPWNGRIDIIHSSLQDFINLAEKRYDLIVSNPPFFSLSLKSDQCKRNISRHNDSLSFRELIQCTSLLMTEKASLWLILPVKESREFISTASLSGFFIHCVIKVIPKQEKVFHRVILQLKKTPAIRTKEKTLTIKNMDNSYSSEYKEVTEAFYIDF
jgi:tRNA1Val (adenine37-N6)-methyltransferase